MIGRLFQLARGFVYPGAFERPFYRLGHPDVIDAIAEIASESCHSVVPPGELLSFFVQCAESIIQTPLAKSIERSAFRVAYHDRTARFNRIIDIVVMRCDVEIAKQANGRVCRKRIYLLVPVVET